ncbi:unnamed protein product [Spodoptera littoralis]|uniref:Uncharacterized protein n=1 Tax=Spodoptera littoralis TaxID=7109 RepID=A0A9P0IDX6_SPOLI|nr:unnamed protein product [Spodoptera littoralis]CAH1645309.1 unnamed protein product [Spodoptera littoralis]
MIGRADIEGSKCNVAAVARLPQTSYPCVPMRTEHQDQASFCPSTLREVSVLAELALGHLRYYLTGVPPQSNSPPGSVLEPDHAESASTFTNWKRDASRVREIDLDRRSILPEHAASARLHFHCAFQFIISMTRIHARLLGPCFKTGPASARNRIIADRNAHSPRQYDSDCRSTAPTSAQRRQREVRCQLASSWTRVKRVHESSCYRLAADPPPSRCHRPNQGCTLKQPDSKENPSRRAPLSLRASHPLWVNGLVQDELGHEQSQRENGTSRTPHFPPQKV